MRLTERITHLLDRADARHVTVFLICAATLFAVTCAGF